MLTASTAPPVTPRFGRAGLIATGLAGLGVAALLVGILVTLLATRSTLSDQRDLTRVLLTRLDPTLQKAPGTLDQASPILRDAAPLLKSARSSLPQLRRAGRDGRQLLSEAPPTLARLNNLLTGFGPVARDLQPVSAQLRAADLPSLLAAATELFSTAQPAVARLTPITRELAAADLPGLVGNVRSLTLAGTRTLPAVDGLVAEVDRRELPRRLSRTLPMIGSLNQLQTAALSTVRQTLTRTARTEDLLRESLAVQNRLLDRVSSIDRKIPGPTAP